MSRAAVITIVHGRHAHLARQADSLRRSVRRPPVWVVVALADPGIRVVLEQCASGLTVELVEVPEADARRLPIAHARNRGADAALRAGVDTLVFLDVDCLAAPELVGGYQRVVERHPDTIWSGPVTYLPDGLDERRLRNPWLLDDPHPARPAPPPGQLQHDAPPELFWSLSFALAADTWRRVGGFCEEYDGYGAEDTDFAFTAQAREVGLGWVGDARAYHQPHPETTLAARSEDIVRNGGVFARRWGWWPMQGWLRELEESGLVRRDGEGWELSTPSPGPRMSAPPPGTGTVPTDRTPEEDA